MILGDERFSTIPRLEPYSGLGRFGPRALQVSCASDLGRLGPRALRALDAWGLGRFGFRRFGRRAQTVSERKLGEFPAVTKVGQVQS